MFISSNLWAEWSGPTTANADVVDSAGIVVGHDAERVKKFWQVTALYI